MTNKLARAAHQKLKRENSKSRLTPSKNLSLQDRDVQTIFKSARVSELTHDFQKEIMNPIQLYSQMYQAKAPQKCLLHNNISTLYCVKDERLLCAGCMYQTPIHKGHKVIPLNKAEDNMKEDIKNTLTILEEQLKISKKVIEKTAMNLQKAEKDYPQLMQQIHNFFMDLHQLLIDKKNSHLRLLNQIWSKLRYQNHMMKAEMIRIHDYIQQKVLEVNERQKNEDLTFNKNVVDHLCRINQIVDEGMVKIEDNPYFKEIAKFKKVPQFIQNNLVLVQIKGKSIQSLYLGDYKLKKSSSKSSIKKNSMLTPKVSSKNDSPRTREKNAEAILLEMFRSNTIEGDSVVNNSPKNRHSKSQVRLMAELTSRKKQFQKKQLKNLKRTPSKSQKNMTRQATLSSISVKKGDKNQKSKIKSHHLSQVNNKI